MTATVTKTTTLHFNFTEEDLERMLTEKVRQYLATHHPESDFRVEATVHSRYEGGITAKVEAKSHSTETT